MRRALLAVGAMGLFGSLTLAPSMASASSTVGAADLSGTPIEQCGASPGDPCNFVPLNTPSGAQEPGSPITGVVTSLRMRTTGPAATLMIRPVRLITGLTFLNVGPEVAFPVTADGTGAGHITQATGVRMPISAGDRLGIGYTLPIGGGPQLGVISPSAACGYLQGPGADHPVGTQKTYITNGSCSAELLLQGTVEADADRDGFGDETQDQCPTNGATQGPCPVTPPTKKKKCKHKKKHKSGAVIAKKCKKKHH